MMAEINTVISGDYLGKRVEAVWGKVCIIISILSKEDISAENIVSLNYIRDVIISGNKLTTEAKVKFKTGKECTIWVDTKIFMRLQKIWPRDRLKELLDQGFKIVGFSTNFLGSAFGTSTFLGQAAAGMKRMHTLLLQKDSHVEIVTILDNGVGKRIEPKSSSIIINT